MKIEIDSGYLVVSDEDRSILKAEFDKLQTIKEKYDFWQEKFDLNYSLNSVNNIQEHTFSEFLIRPDDKEGIQELNKRVYNDCLNLVSGYSSMGKIDIWRSEFEDEIKQVSEKENYIEYEIGKVDEFVLAHKRTITTFGKKRSRPTSTNSQFLEAYENYRKYKTDLDWGVRVYRPYEIYNYLRGIECAKYREFLRNYVKNDKPKKEEGFRLTGEQKFLILHYLKFGNEVKANTKRAVLYELFLGLTEKTIRPMFSDISRYETVENLNQIIDFFKDIKLHSEAREVQVRLDKLNKRG